MSLREVQNRKARRDFHVHEQIEAGIELRGTEVKSLRAGEGNLNDSFARIEKGQAWLYNMHINPYEMAHRDNHEPKRERRLLLHKTELRKLYQDISKSGRTLIPLKGYFKGSHFKVLLGLCTGKDKGDKREDIKKREADRHIQRVMKNR